MAADPFSIEQTEPAGWAIKSLLVAADEVHEAMRRRDFAVRRSMLRKAQESIARATLGLNEALALCEARPDKVQPE